MAAISATFVSEPAIGALRLAWLWVSLAETKHTISSMPAPSARSAPRALGANRALVFSRDGNDVALAFAFAAVAGSFLVSYTRARAEALGLKGDVGIGSRAERVVVIVTGLVLAPWGVLPWAIYLLTATAWITVVQRVLAVRSQLRQQ